MPAPGRRRAAATRRPCPGPGGPRTGEVDLLLFAAVSADVQEPANAHIVAARTGLSCPVFDVSNACNSVLNALEVADAFIRAGRYRRILIACGETLSRWSLTPTTLRTGLASLPAGTWAPPCSSKPPPQPGIIAHTFMANSAGWPTAPLFNPHHAPGGPPGLHFDSEKVLASFLGIDTRAAQWMKEQHTDPNEFGLGCLHQPSVPFVRTFCERMGIQPDAVVPTFHRTGNMGAATLLLQLAHAADQGR
ncbi:3-oxoacyl-ACP synthase III family protein [Streptomyces canus]|uniref:3-oxoacyl-ACP synthase III family protein n=1 Tax=Streptomyces canus TaxID=58343 RepID=UPI00324339A8